MGQGERLYGGFESDSPGSDLSSVRRLLSRSVSSCVS